MSNFPTICQFPIHWGELDALGHANHTRFLVWMESARIKLFEEIGLMNQTSLGPILADLQVSYRQPVHYPANLWCGVRVSRIGTKSFTLHYAVGHQGDLETWLAEGSTVIVVYDYNTNSSAEIPSTLRQKLEAKRISNKA